MTKVYCPNSECIYNGRRGNCKADKLNLEYRNMATVNEGRVDMWICDRYELTDEAKGLMEKFKRMMDV